MIYNILNGDSLAYSFPDTKIEGDVIIVREALIDGDLSGANLHDFWQSRHGDFDPEKYVFKSFKKAVQFM